MQSNPYNPPAAETLEKKDDNFAKRPISVWLLEGMLVLLSLNIIIPMVRSFFVLFPERLELYGPVNLALNIALSIAIVIAMVYSIRCLHRGVYFAKWIAVAIIVGFVAFAISRPDGTQYMNDAERTGGFFARYVVFPMLFLWWGYALGFSQNAKNYFSKR